MKTRKQEDFCKVVGLGILDYDFKINLSKEEASSFNFDLDKINSNESWKKILKNKSIRDKIRINSNSNLINLLLFLNKTSSNKAFVEYLSLNTFSLVEELSFLKDKIKNDYDNNFLFLIEQNIIPPYPSKFTINIEGKSKEIDFGTGVIYQEEIDQEEDLNDEYTRQVEKKMQERIQSENHGSKESKDQKEFFDSRKESLLEKEFREKSMNFDLNENKIDSPVNKVIKFEENKDLEEAEINDEQINKEVFFLPRNNCIKSKEEEETKEKEDKSNLMNDANLNQKDEIIKEKNEENTDELEEIKNNNQNVIEHNEIENHEINKNGDGDENLEDNEKILLGTSPENQNEPIEPEGKDNNENNSPKMVLQSNQILNKDNLLSNLRYDYDSIDYIFLDLNQFISNQINLFDLLKYITVKISTVKNALIVVIFPNLDKIETDSKSELIDTLNELISYSDIIVYERKDAMLFCSLLGYKVDEKNFEVRFMFLKEFKKSKKYQKTCIFIEDFNKLSVIIQETSTSLLTYHNDFKFEIGFKMDFFETVSKHFEYLKFVFLGAFFSGVVQKSTFEQCFKIGSQTFKKVLEIIQNDLEIPENSEYFYVNLKGLIVKGNKNEKNFDKKFKTSSNFNNNITSEIKNRENNFILDSVRISNKKGQKIVIEALPKQSYKLPYNGNSQEKKIQLIKNTKAQLKTNNLIDAEQKKLHSIIKANEKIQEKLNKLLSNSPEGLKLFENELKYKSKQLPSLKKQADKKKIQTEIINKVEENESKKKNLKPISQEIYDRLTGNNKKNLLVNEFVQKNVISDSQNKNQENELNQYEFSPFHDKDLNLSNEGGNKQLKEKEKSINQGNFSTEKLEIKIKIAKPKLRLKKQLIPVCNLVINEEEAQKFQSKIVEKRKKEFKDHAYFDSLYRKNRGLDLFSNHKEKQPAVEESEGEIAYEKGRKEDFNDLNRILEKLSREKEKSREIREGDIFEKMPIEVNIKEQEKNYKNLILNEQSDETENLKIDQMKIEN